MREVRAGPALSQPLYGGAPYLETQELTGFDLGQRVRHAKFGEGVVLNAEGQGRSARVQVNFEAVGSKWLVVAYANLTPV
jgi:DNA helicase-2/ATP-dependent DNA helicase PcrA